MMDYLKFVSVALVVAALALAFLRRRGVALPWWIDWLGASADVVIAAVAGVNLGWWLTRPSSTDESPPGDDHAGDGQPAAGESHGLPTPTLEPPTHDVEGTHQELEDELEAIDEQSSAELEADLKELLGD